jgi:hypothetical protein
MKNHPLAFPIRATVRIAAMTALLFLLTPAVTRVRAAEPLRAVFDGGVTAANQWTLKELNPDLPSDWSDYNYLVLELRQSTPQRFHLWLDTASGPRQMVMQVFGQGVWTRCSIPLKFLKGRDQQGNDLASANNRRTDTFWMMIWGPFGPLQDVRDLRLVMDYPLNQPVIEIRSVQLAKDDPGNDWLEPDKKPVVDEFGQWANADWSRKIKSREQLRQELADEDRNLAPGDFGYDRFGGYSNTQAKATGFFRVEQVDGKWWYVDPDGHLFLSTGSNGAGGRGGGGGRGGPGATNSAPSAQSRLTARRMQAWGLTTGGPNMGMPYVMQLGYGRGQTTLLGLPDVYSQQYADAADTNAERACASRKDDPLLIGYFLGNEPPWQSREAELAGMILAGKPTATQDKLKEFLGTNDTPARRKEFIMAAFDQQLAVSIAAIKRYDTNHLILGIRFGGSPSEDMLKAGRVFDVCSINIYEYEPTKAIERTYRMTGRPVMLTEFHFGVPENGLGAGLVQTRDQIERAKGYRYYVEQSAAEPSFVGAHWFTWQDEPVLGRMDGENYNIGFIDATGRPYPELVDAVKATHRRLYDVHAGKAPPFNERPKVAGDLTSPSPWGENRTGF